MRWWDQKRMVVLAAAVAGHWIGGWAMLSLLQFAPRFGVAANALAFLWLLLVSPLGLQLLAIQDPDFWTYAILTAANSLFVVVVVAVVVRIVAVARSSTVRLEVIEHPVDGEHAQWWSP